MKAAFLQSMKVFFTERARQAFSLTAFSLLFVTWNAQAAIVNISATVSGAGNISSATDLSDPVNPVQITLAAGTYNLQIVNPSLDPDATYSGWSRCCDFYYSTAYAVFNANDNSNYILYGGEYLSEASGMDAFTQTVTDGLNLSTLTLTTTTTLNFIIPDGILDDNAGGASVSVTPQEVSAPEPSSLFLCGMFLVGYFGLQGAKRLCRLRRTFLTQALFKE